MQKNTVLAFLLIFAAIFFFNSEFYYNKILGRPHPGQVAKKEAAAAREKMADEKAPPAAAAQQAAPAPAPAPVQARQAVVPTLRAPATVDSSVTTLAPLRPMIVETPRYICTIDRRGGRIISWKMKGFSPNAAKDTARSAELIPWNSRGAATVSFSGRSFDSLAFTCLQADSLDTLRMLGKTDSLVLTFVSPGVEGIEKEFTFRGNDWRFGLAVRKRNLGVGKLKIGWPCGLRAIDSALSASSGMSGSGPGSYAGFLFYGDDVEQADDFTNGVREYTGSVRWAGMKEGYFGSAIILPSKRDAQVEFTEQKAGKTLVQMGYTVEEDFESGEMNYELFAGPLQYSLVKSYGLGLEGIIFQGYTWFLRADLWFPPICGFVIWLLNFFYGFIPDYGVSIILLTIISRIIMIPLTNKSQSSMSAMKDLQPKMTEIRAKYKSDPTRMNQELMKLYKKHGVNPMGAGCLPMLLQMPIFIALFIGLRKAVELRGAETFLGWITDLSRPDVIFYLPFTVPFYGKGVCLLPILMTIATFFQNKMTIKDPQQKFMVYFMPIFFLFLFNSFPAGLNLYWTLSTAIGILQQLYIERRKKQKAALQTVQAAKA